MSQDLYDLPEGWEWRRLDELCNKITDGSHNPPKEVVTGKPMLSSRNIFDGVLVWDNYRLIDTNSFEVEDKRTRVEEGDVLLTIVGTIGRTCVVRDITERFTLQRSVAVIAPKDNLSADFLSLQFRSPVLQRYLNENAKGAAQKGIYLKQLKSINIAVPPLAEQTRIVEKLDAVLSRIDTAIDELQQSLVLVDAMFKSGLDGVFEDIYAHSAIKKLSELTTKIGSGATPKGGGSAYKESGISLIRSLNVHDLNFKYDGLAFIDDEQAKALSNVEVSSGDVLLNITGASIARCCIVPDGILPARVNQHVCILRPNHLLNSEFLNYLIVSPKFKSALLFQGAGGATRQALTKAMIESFDIPVPTLEKQVEAIQRITQLNEQTTQLKTELTAKIGMFNQLKASVLDGAFRGEV